MFLGASKGNMEKKRVKFDEKWNWSLTHFMQPVSFYTTWKQQKTRSFLKFADGIEKDQWHEIT